MSYIYVAESGDGYCKIGASKNPETRFKAIQNETGLSITKFAYFKCFGDLFVTESKCHKRIDGALFGEWFFVEFDIACGVVEFECKSKHQRSAGNCKVIPQWMPTIEQRKHLSKRAAEEGTTLTGYLKQLVNADMKKKK